MGRRYRCNLLTRALVLLLGIVGCGGGGPTGFQANCTPGTPSAEALLPAGDVPGQPGKKILIDGRMLTPSGAQIVLGGFPLAMRFVGGGSRFLAITDGAEYAESLRV